VVRTTFELARQQRAQNPKVVRTTFELARQQRAQNPKVVRTTVWSGIDPAPCGSTTVD